MISRATTPSPSCPEHRPSIGISASRAQISRSSLAPRFVTNSGDTAIALAFDGAGIARVLYYQVELAIREGRLVEVLAPFAPAVMPIHAVYPSARFLSGKVRAFVELIGEMADWRLAR